MFVFKLYYKSMRKKVMAKNTFSVKNDMQYLFKPKVSLSKIERKKKRRACAGSYTACPDSVIFTKNV